MSVSKLAPEFLALKSRALRDLAWSLTCSSLFSPIPSLPSEWFKSDYFAEDQFLAWLQYIDASPTILAEHLSQQRSTRLGIYFEQLLSFYFSYYECNGRKRFELLAKNYQVIEKKRTLGEFDFIVLDNTNGDIKHIEVAVKFYLGHHNYNQSNIYPIEKNRPLHNWHNWVGPNFRDTLAIKMRHLQEHQLLLSQSNAGTESLTQLLSKSHIDTSPFQTAAKPIQCRLHMSGRFFSPLLESIDNPLYAKNTATDFWLYYSDFIDALTPNTSQKNWHKSILDLYKTTEVQYCLLPKQYWLSEITEKDIEEAQLQLLDENCLLNFLTNDTEENQWHLAIIDRQRVDKRILSKQNKNAHTLHIEHGRFFIIRKE